MSDRLKALMPLIDALDEGEMEALRERIAEPELSEEEWEAAWMEEVERRQANLAAGRTKLVSHEEFLRQLRSIGS